MKILLVGLGSMGVRHLKNLHCVFKKRGKSITVDVLNHAPKMLPNEIEILIANRYYSYLDLPNDYNIAVIANPTNLHADTIRCLVDKTQHMFIEKPIFDEVETDIGSLMLKNGVYYVACPLRYSSVVQYMEQFIKKNHVYMVRSICSSYLPDWRPGTDYRHCYSASKEMGGGVRADLIHEWDYLCYLFGQPENVCSFSGKFSDLDITSEDAAVYIARYPDKVISLHLDYLGRFPIRNLEFYTNKDIVIGDFINQNIRFLRTGEVIPLLQERDDMQQKEWEHFINITEGLTDNTNNIYMAKNTLRIALGGLS